MSTRKKAPSPDTREPLSVVVAGRLRKDIVSGKLALGEELPSENELTRALGVSRSTVREALRILQAQGLVSSGGAVSTRRSRVSTEDVLTLAAAQALENVVRLAHTPLEDLVELRLVIEGAAVEAAARTRGEALTEAAATVEAMKARGLDLDTFRAADLLFHRALARASGNTAYPLTLGVLRSAIAGHLGEALAREPQPQRAMARLAREHEAILEAVAAGHPTRARELMTQHIGGFYRRRPSHG